MTRFNIGGSFLELSANFKIQLKKSNILFAFDNVELERSTSFSVPATPINTGIFGWANDAHRFGERGRQKIAAQLQMDGVTKDGFLHITKYTPEAFECVFVTGDLLGLADIKALGDWGKFILPSNGVRMDADVRIASSGNDYSAARVQYRTDGYIMPSWKLSSYAKMALQRAAVDINWGEVLDALNTYRIIIPKAKGVSETAVTLTRKYAAEQTSATPYPVLNSALLDDQGELANVVTIEQSEYPIFKVKTADATQYYGYVMQFVAKQDMTLKFADDTPDTLFLASAQMNGTFDFLGGYLFAADGTITGDPLKGREVEISTDQTFLLISQNDYLRAGMGEFEGWTIANEELTASVVVKGKDEQPNNAYIRVKDNVPAMTIVELVKVIAALSGKILSYQAGEIVFVDNIAGGELVELDKPLKWSNLTRGVGDYAQKNLVTFKDGGLTATYSIDNVNIELEKELLAIPMNAGSDVAGDLFVAGDTEEYTIARYVEGQIDLQRIEVPKNESLEKILFQSTSLTAEVKMSEREFDKLPFDAQLRFDNSLYAWTDGVWSNGVASLSLSRLKGEYTPPPPPPYIPAEYQQVEWLQSDGSSYIKTGVFYRQDMKCVLTFKPFYQSGIHSMFGAMDTATNKYWAGSIGSKATIELWREEGSGGSISNAVPEDESIYIEFGPLSATETYAKMEYAGNSFSKTGVSPAYSAPRELFAFAVNRNGSVSYYSRHKLYSLSVSVKSMLLRTFVPCYHKASLVAGMYDRVNGVFYTNAGTGSFIVGPDVNT